MPEQLEAFPRDNRYDVWTCAKCGGTRIIQAVPHRPPTCCGTGMWFKEARVGATYMVDYHARDV